MTTLEEKIQEKRDELEKLEAKLKAELKKQKTPQPIVTKEEVSENMHAIYDFAIDIRNSMANEGRPPKDSDNYAFEMIMESVFGEDYWDWHNKQYS